MVREGDIVTDSDRSRYWRDAIAGRGGGGTRSKDRGHLLSWESKEAFSPAASSGAAVLLTPWC